MLAFFVSCCAGGTIWHKIELSTTLIDIMYVLRRGAHGSPITLCTLGGDGRFVYQELQCLIYNRDTLTFQSFMYVGKDGVPRLHIVSRNTDFNSFRIWRVESPTTAKLICIYKYSRDHIDVQSDHLFHVLLVGPHQNRSYIHLFGDLLYVSMPERIICIDMRIMVIHRIIEHGSCISWKIMVTSHAIYAITNDVRNKPIDGIVYCNIDIGVYHHGGCQFEGFTYEDRMIYINVSGTRYRCFAAHGESVIRCSPDNKYTTLANQMLFELHYFDGNQHAIAIDEYHGLLLDKNNIRLIIVDMFDNMYEIHIEGDMLEHECTFVAC